MEERPKPRIWNGENDESDSDEDEILRHRSINSDVAPTTDVDMR